MPGRTAYCETVYLGNILGKCGLLLRTQLLFYSPSSEPVVQSYVVSNTRFLEGVMLYHCAAGVEEG